MSKLSVVIAVRDRRKHLDRCLKSLGFQTLEDFETIIVDYGGTDNLALESPIRLIRVEEYGPFCVSKARNIGIRNATGDYILGLDADMILHSSTLSCLMEQYKLVGDCLVHLIVRSDMGDDEEMLSEIDTVDKSSYDALLYRIWKKHKFTAGRPRGGTFISAPRKDFVRLGGYDEMFTQTYAEDADMSYRLEHSGLDVYYPRSLKGFHMWHKQTAESNNTEQRRKQTIYYQSKWGKKEHFVRNKDIAWGKSKP